jgi:hypothetical protein
MFCSRFFRPSIWLYPPKTSLIRFPELQGSFWSYTAMSLVFLTHTKISNVAERGRDASFVFVQAMSHYETLRNPVFQRSS